MEEQMTQELDKGGELEDIRDVVIDPSAPVEERLASLAEQLGGDPTHFRVGDVEVSVSFAGQVPLEQAVARILGAKGTEWKAAPKRRPAEIAEGAA